MIRYNQGSDIIEVKIKDCSGRTIEKWVCQSSEQKRWESTINHINRKYGFNLVFEVNLKKLIEEGKPITDFLKEDL